MRRRNRGGADHFLVRETPAHTPDHEGDREGKDAAVGLAQAGANPLPGLVFDLLPVGWIDDFDAWCNAASKKLLPQRNEVAQRKELAKKSEVAKKARLL